MFAAERARAAGARVVLDLDFRPDQWLDVRVFGVAVRSVMPLVDVVLGTEDEVKAAVLSDASKVQCPPQPGICGARRGATRPRAIQSLLALGPEVVVDKRGQLGAAVHLPRDGESLDVPGFAVEVQNVLGAGDAFAAGFLSGHVDGRGWYESARLGNACGAIVVTKHGCANFMPTAGELARSSKITAAWSRIAPLGGILQAA